MLAMLSRNEPIVMFLIKSAEVRVLDGVSPESPCSHHLLFTNTH